MSWWVIYARPTDRPEHFVGRRHEVLDGDTVATDDIVTGDTVEEVRARLPRGLYCLPIDPTDDPRIVEVWV